MGLLASNPAYTLLAASRLRPGQDVLPAEVAWLEMDLSGGDVWIPPNVQAVVHLAGEKRDPSRMRSVNVVGTRTLVEAAIRAGVKRFVHVSSVGVYGASSLGGMVTEATPRHPNNLYEQTKDAAEEVVRSLCTSSGLEFVILQPSNIVGYVPGRVYSLLSMLRAIQAGWFTRVGGGASWVNYVPVEDVANAVLAGLDVLPCGHSYIVNTPVPLDCIVTWMAGHLGVREPTRMVPLWLGRAGAKIGSALEHVLGRSMPFNDQRLQELINTTRFDGSRYAAIVGSRVQPLGMNRAIGQLVSAYRQEGKL